MSLWCFRGIEEKMIVSRMCTLNIDEAIKTADVKDTFIWSFKSNEINSTSSHVYNNMSRCKLQQGGDHKYDKISNYHAVARPVTFCISTDLIHTLTHFKLWHFPDNTIFVNFH